RGDDAAAEGGEERLGNGDGVALGVDDAEMGRAAVADVLGGGAGHVVRDAEARPVAGRGRDGASVREGCAAFAGVGGGGQGGEGYTAVRRGRQPGQGVAGGLAAERG